MKLVRFKSIGNLLLAALLMLAVWVLLVWVASRPALKTLIDLTPQRVNSVDPVTEELLRDLRAKRAEIEFHLFYPPMAGEGLNDAERQSIAIRNRLRDLTELLLVRYQFLGGEAVTIHSHDFYGDVPKTREAAQSFDYNSAAENEVLVVAVRQVGKERRFRKLSLVSDMAVIEVPNAGPGNGPVRSMPVPVLKDYKGEEAISSALKSLLVQGTPVAYFLTSYSRLVDFETTTNQMGYGGLRAALVRSGFDVRRLDLRQTTVVPPDATLVVVLEPTSDFAERDAVALFEYVKRGGRVFVNYVWSPISDMNPEGGKFGELLGYEVGSQVVFHMIADLSRRAVGGWLDGNDGVANLQLGPNPLHPTTKRLAEAGRVIEVKGARAVRERAGAPTGVRREALLQTGSKAWLAVPGPEGLPDFHAPRGVGLRSFDVGMAFEVDAPGADPSSAGSPRTGQVVVVSGAFCNNVGMPLFGSFALNICNWMAERRVLLDIQGSRYQANHLQLTPQQFDRVWYLLVYGVPGAFLLLGLLVYLRRRI